MDIISYDDEVKKTNISHIKIKDKMINLDDKYKNKNKDNNKKYFRYLKNTNINNKTKNCFVTMIILSNSYMPALLNTGYSLKNIVRTKYNTVCLVQDRPHYEKDDNGKNFIKFQGLSSENIEDIKKIYDVVIGIDLLKINISKQSTKYYINYQNIIYYCTRNLILGLTEYTKMIYLDASTYLTNNIDKMFDEYNVSTYKIGFLTYKLKRGLVGNFIFIKNEPHFLVKSLYLISNYSKFFNDNFNSLFTYDEDIMYYSIYPHWNNIVINDDIFFNLIVHPNFQKDISDKNKYSVMLNARLKPFRYPLIKDNRERSFYTNNGFNYKYWDENVNKLIEEYQEFKKYFEYIKTYRYTQFNF